MCQRSTSLHWSPQYQQFLEGCRLSGVLPVLGHTPCKELVTALIERWRPETNTFHLVPGEATITLEDVEVLTGLPTTGRPLIVSPDEQPVPEICEQPVLSLYLRTQAKTPRVRPTRIMVLLYRLYAGCFRSSLKR
ncbi:Protein MAINTENANCE OF MERISTEMS [Linum perenne]